MLFIKSTILFCVIKWFDIENIFLKNADIVLNSYVINNSDNIKCRVILHNVLNNIKYIGRYKQEVKKNKIIKR